LLTPVHQRRKRPPKREQNSAACDSTTTDSVQRLPDRVGDEPIVVYKSERLRWVNADTLTHVIVADSADATDFRKADELSPGGSGQSVIMTRLGTTRIHCDIHPT